MKHLCSLFWYIFHCCISHIKVQKIALVPFQKVKLFAPLCFALLCFVGFGIWTSSHWVAAILFLVPPCFLTFVSIAWCFPTPTLFSQPHKLLHAKLWLLMFLSTKCFINWVMILHIIQNIFENNYILIYIF